MNAARLSGSVSAITLFVGSFLLFLVQPLLGRTLLPVFGGSASVWTVCLAAYQVLLLAGYAYAHGLAGLALPTQRRLHLALLGVACLWTGAFAALRPGIRTFFGDSAVPSLEVLFCVLAFSGLPYVALAAGSTLVQAWVARTGAGRSVYRLYAVSNLGSFAGLLAYPFVMEPFVSLTVQWWGVAAGLAVYAGLMALAGRGRDDEGPLGRARAPAASAGRPSPAAVRLWFLLPGVSAFLLNAVTAHLFTDVTPMPLVWVVVLATFLLSYVVGFSRLAEVRRGVWCGLAVLSLAGAAFANGKWGAGSFYPNAAAAVAVLFFGGVVLHGWLYEERPEPAGLTRYYLAIAAGGAAGGLLPALVAPVVFDRVLEFPFILCVCMALVVERVPKPAALARSKMRRWAGLCGGAAWLLLALAVARHTSSSTLSRCRNFYGTLRVTRTLESFGARGALPVHYLWCGQTTHGVQVCAPALSRQGTAYFGRMGGGIAFASHPKYRVGQSVKAGVVGLGAGCLAVYGRTGDLFRFYEINPLVVRIACDPQLFTFLKDAPMPIDLVPGDARRMLEKEEAAGDPLYDILVIDAYSGDAIPYHLATEEAFRLYFERLEHDGVLAVHVSNWHIDLLPLCKAVSRALGVVPYGVVSVAEDQFTADAIWVFMSRQPMTYRLANQACAQEVVWEKIRDVAVPTDEQGSLLPLLRW
jgi:hypothetical protein